MTKTSGVSAVTILLAPILKDRLCSTVDSRFAMAPIRRLLLILSRISVNTNAVSDR